ncbi:AbrB/MazE/SpoVT family DNA-binding domain-containing protein [Bacillus sp. V59.32b]|uniref:AbrB/MazE/SpoVT family DNA-binding domain-containing protein n=1 Tax=Bacillus sp. V59.32b TaxID=1758642 RepID=UPI000E3EE3C6|nr:AbrB/MazE/SpoVT family DNA-binding domain-containing protein [Bacillus sp. V59.32b]RFU60066.1 AbrB/MazE/SpoVT family DNA-binding domain-containing protein [Bacillus sp. V59.32b]
MKELLSGKVTEKGQVTIPIQVREKLNIRSGDRLAYLIDDEEEEIRIKVIKQTNVEDVFGIFKVDKSLTFDKEREQAHENVVVKFKQSSEGDKEIE